MRWQDQLQFNLRVLSRQRFRTVMQLIAMSIGVFAVVLLTGLGEGGRQYVMAEFSVLGKDTLIIMPGRKETSGGMPPLTGGTRDITLQDVQSLARLRNVEGVAALVVGKAEISYGGRNRDTLILGANADFFSIRNLQLQKGQMLPDMPLDQARPICIIGPQLKRELFSAQPALGQWLKISGSRCRVIGILADSGTGLSFDMNSALIMPVASSMQLFNTEGLFRVMVDVRAVSSMAKLARQIEQVMQQRHEGQLDITVITPASVLSAFDDILAVITVAIAGIGGISLFVAGVLIMNMTLISVSQRTAEIGLLKALGASSKQVRLLFVSEALMLCLAGAVLGIVIAELLLGLASMQFKDLQFIAPWWASILALLVALGCGLIFSWIPARKAASLPPVEALR
jgi:putative ABC transport system permease protein